MTGAVETFARGVEKNPEWVQGYIYLGNISAEQGKLDEAIGYFEKAVALRPREVQVNLDLTRALEFAGRIEAAIEAGQAAVERIWQAGEPGRAKEVED